MPRPYVLSPSYIQTTHQIFVQRDQFMQLVLKLESVYLLLNLNVINNIII